MDLRNVDLERLNSATKYPSILTYHRLDPGTGCLLDEVQVDFAGETEILLTEKLDGTNARIVLVGDSFVIGSREELLHARGDLIWNPSQGIVEAIRGYAERLVATARDAIEVVYGEAYGGKIGSNARQYTGEGKVGFRVFDRVSIAAERWAELATQEPRKIAAWRDGGGQGFAGEETLGQLELERVPVLGTVAALPRSVAETHDFLRERIAETRASLDTSGKKRPEGLVVRTKDRRKIAKIRFEDYERTLSAVSRRR